MHATLTHTNLATLAIICYRSLPLTTHYGTVVALSHFHCRVTEFLIVPRLAAYLSYLLPILEPDASARARRAASVNADIRRMQAQHVYGALLLAVGRFVQYKHSDVLQEWRVDGGNNVNNGATVKPKRKSKPSVSCSAAMSSVLSRVESQKQHNVAFKQAVSSQQQPSRHSNTKMADKVDVGADQSRSSLIDDSAAISSSQVPLELLLGLFGEGLLPYIQKSSPVVGHNYLSDAYL